MYLLGHNIGKFSNDFKLISEIYKITTNFSTKNTLVFLDQSSSKNVSQTGGKKYKCEYYVLQK